MSNLNLEIAANCSFLSVDSTKAETGSCSQYNSACQNDPVAFSTLYHTWEGVYYL